MPSVILSTVYLIIFVISSFHAQNQTKSQHDNLIFFKSIECYVNDAMKEKFIYPNESCSVKIYSRKLSVANFYMVFRKPITKMFVSLLNFIKIKVQIECCFKAITIFYFLDGSSFREVIRTPRIELCDIGRFASDNFFLRHWVAFLLRNVGSLIHQCPYEGVKFEANYPVLML